MENETLLALQQDVKSRDLAILALEDEVAQLKLDHKIQIKNIGFALVRIEDRLDKVRQVQERMRGVDDVVESIQN